MASRKRKDKKKKRPVGRPHRPTDPIAALARDLDKDAVVLTNVPGEVKMSEVLIDFLDPYMKDWKTIEDFRWLVSFGALAWNASMLPEQERQEILHQMETAVGPDGWGEIRAMFQGLVRRKLSRYAHNTRFIFEHTVTLQPDGSPYLAVASSLSKPPPPDLLPPR